MLAVRISSLGNIGVQNFHSVHRCHDHPGLSFSPFVAESHNEVFRRAAGDQRDTVVAFLPMKDHFEAGSGESLSRKFRVPNLGFLDT